MLLLAAIAGPAFRPNAQVYSSAQSRDQAAIIFGYAAKMVRMDEDLSRAVHVKDTAKELIGLRTGVHYKALSADATTAHGTSPALVIHDETGRVRGPRSELYDALETGMGAHKNPLQSSSARRRRPMPICFRTLIDSAKASDDPTTKLFLWAADPEDDPWAEETWHEGQPRSRHDPEPRGAAAHGRAGASGCRRWRAASATCISICASRPRITS